MTKNITFKVTAPGAYALFCVPTADFSKLIPIPAIAPSNAATVALAPGGYQLHYLVSPNANGTIKIEIEDAGAHTPLPPLISDTVSANNPRHGEHDFTV
jgi:hypothetical protein